MFGKFFVFCILFVSIGFASGFEAGSYVKVTKTDGGVISGTIKKVRANAKFECYDSSKHFFKIAANRVTKLTAQKGMKFSNLTGSYKHKVIELKLTNGESVYCGFTKSITLEIQRSGTIRPFTITDGARYVSAEIIEKITKPSKGIIIELLSGERITVPVDKKDVRSIIFE